jgi:ubiquinone/menaquinone biosynthesis C-methylase UbiE
MAVNIETTSRKYHGNMAANYETKRKKQQRWDLENEVVKRFLSKIQPRSILDVPCGTGRYFPLYDQLRVRRVLAVDVSDSMLAIAKHKTKKITRTTITLKRKDVRRLKVKPVDVSVCVRFLDLIDESAMREVMRKLMKVSSIGIICTIRLGESYIAKSNTATHDEQKFRKLLKYHGWRIAKSVPVFAQGWFIFLLRPDT